MKNILFVLLLTITVKAQIVSIPNANFKAKLLASSTTAYIAYNASSVRIKIDTNNDGQIQVSEAQQVYILGISYSNISDLTGIQSFINLSQLTCNGNQLTSLNVSGMVNLLSIDCAYNLISNLNVSNLGNLQRISCHNNRLTNVDLSGIGLTNLQSLYCQDNLLSNLNVIGLPALSILYCQGNLLTSLNVSNMNSLNILYCGYNSLVNLNISGLVNLSGLECQNNQLTSINFIGLNSLYYVNCSYNNLSAIDLSVRPNLDMELDCSYNQNLLTINSKDNQAFEDIDAPPFLPPIQHASIYFRGTPNLQSICADSGELVYLQNKRNQVGYTNPNCQISATCPFSLNEVSVTACGSYTWSVNNQAYTTSGVYRIVNGFNTNQLNLTINTICESIVNLRVNIEGFYDTGTHAMRPVKANQGDGNSSTSVENITVELRNPISKELVATTTTMLNTNGNATAIFNPFVNGSYYLVVKHRNAIETWSSSIVSIGALPLSYDYTTSASKAYGNNMKQIETGVWAIYSGDINQDKGVDNLDIDALFSDINTSNFGVLATDLNGDGGVDNLDSDTVFPNIDNSIFSNHP